MTTLKYRKACIVTESGALTEFFDILIGCLQGDRNSPQLFKICINPLLLKIVLEEKIVIPQSLPYIAHIRENPADPLVGFADDLNILCKPTGECFRAIKSIFDNFTKISNLTVNDSKTKIVFHNFNPGAELLQDINELGYSISDRIEILGFDFKADLSDLNAIWDRILVKIKKIKNFWQLLHLSVPGRVNVIRTYFLSQVSYVGTILTPPKSFIDELEDIIMQFIKQKVNIAKNRIFGSVNSGGLGLPHPENFILSLKIKFFLLGIKTKDTWGHETRALFDNHNLLETFNIEKLNLRVNPYLGQLALAFHKFAKNFLVTNGNVRETKIFDNLLFKMLNLQKLSLNDFTLPTRSVHRDSLINLDFQKLIGFRQYDADFIRFKEETLIELSWEEYKHLIKTCKPILTKYKNNFNKPTTTLKKFCSKKTLKSKDFRKFIEPQKDFSSCAPSRSRALWSNATLDQDRENSYFNMWNQNYLPIGLRDFIFKLLNSQIKLKAQVSHLPDQVIAGNCTFCNLQGVQNRENYKHFFVECPTNINLLTDYFIHFFNNNNITWEANWTLRGAPNNLGNARKLIVNTEILVALYYINNCRNKNVLPSMEDLKLHAKNGREIFVLFGKYKKAWEYWTQGVQ